MQPDDEVCLCFHVTRRKIENFVRLERPHSVSQLADCFGAGTGCGWCRPYLQRLFTAGRAPGNQGAATPNETLPQSADYQRQRAAYVREGGGTPPPGATPVESEGEARISHPPRRERS